jgi:pyridoxal phosphate enzyme (YggS family)
MTDSTLGQRLASVRAGVDDAARGAGRDPASITTIVVTKFHSASLVRELVGLGVTDVGENRHQEAQQKAAELRDLDVTWHFVGQLQSKKARQVASYAKVIHSIDRSALVQALWDASPSVDCFAQINLTDDPARGGVDERSLEPLAEEILGCPGLRLLGVMAVAPLGEEPRRAFARLRKVSDRLQRTAPDATAISAGMSGDYPAAIAEGATHLRIGTAITGIRPQHG